MSVPLLDEMLGQFEQRLSVLQQRDVDGLPPLPDELVADPVNAKPNVLTFAQDYEAVLLDGHSLRSLCAESDTWHSALV